MALVFNDIRQINSVSRSEFEQACRNGGGHVYLGDRTVLCRVLTKYKMYVSTEDRQIAPHLLLDGCWEPWITRFLIDRIRPGFICLDIGANVGYYSLLMSELTGTKGRTIAVEPNPMVASLLGFARANHPYPFEVIQCAMSESAGEAILSIPEKSLGGATIKQQSPGTKMDKVTVRTLSVDELVRDLQLPRVDFIKMDIEGMEPIAFAGMKQTLDRNPEIQIIFEYSPTIYPDAEAFTRFLFEHFEVCEVTGSSSLKSLSLKQLPELIAMEGHTDWYLKRKK